MFSANWGVLDVRGKESVRIGVEGRQEKCAPVGAPSRSLFRLFNARLAAARLINQRGLTALAILAAPSLD